MSDKLITRVPAISPVSRLRDKKIWGELKDKGYIIFTHRAEEAAVLVDIDYWNQIVERLSKLKEIHDHYSPILEDYYNRLIEFYEESEEKS